MPNHEQVSAGLKVSNQGSTIALRLPEKVMTLEHMGAMFPHRLSFVRLLLRRLKRENWQFSRPVWRMNADGYGVAVYSFKGPKRTYSLVAFSNELAPEYRTDRVIATAWDSSFTLYDGLPSGDDIARLAANVPLQEAGRISESELSLSRANKSLRLFDHVVDRLAAGLQPDYEIVSSVGYLFRTTAVYGSGKMGAADFEKTGTYPGLAGPFQAEMLVVYLIREFSLDLVEHVAKMRAPKKAVVLTDNIRRQFGVGNSTGLGMAPFLVNHPAILNQWMLVRETALARVRDLPIAGQKDQLMAYASTFHQRVIQWQTDDVAQTHRNQLLCDDMDKLSAFLHTLEFANFTRWNEVYEWSERHLSIDGQEGLISLLIEMNGSAVDDLEALYDVNELNSFVINGLWRIGDVVAALDSDYAWAFDFNFDDPNEMARFWYVSEEKLEPRLGERWHEEGSASFRSVSHERFANFVTHCRTSIWIASFRNSYCSIRSTAIPVADRNCTILDLIRKFVTIFYRRKCGLLICCVLNWLASAPFVLIRGRIAGCAFPYIRTRRLLASCKNLMILGCFQ